MFDAGDKVVAVLKSKGITELDYVVATNPNEDHIGGLITVLNNFPVKSFIDSGKVDTSETYKELHQLIEVKGIPMVVPEIDDKYAVDKFVVEVLHANPEAPDNKSASIVLKAKYGGVNFLLMSDANKKIETTLLQKGGLKSAVLKAGDHGANSSSSANFIKAFNPDYAIMTYGKDNPYGYPHEKAISRIYDNSTFPIGVEFTAEWGNITITTNGLTHRIGADRWTGLGTEMPPPAPPNPYH